MDGKNQHIDELLFDVLSGEADGNRMKQFKSWLDEDEKNVNYYHQVKALWIASTRNKNPHNFNPQLSWLKLYDRIHKKGHLLENFLKYAAIILISFITGAIANYIFYPHQPREFSQMAVTMNEAEAPYGARLKVNLTDGSMVWLNAGSKLYYPNEFSGNSREVKLEGEGYFEVKSDASKPFIVNTKKVSVKALGTSFNVKAYTDEPYVEATLVEGVISVQKQENQEKPFILKPKQKVRIYKDSNQMVEITQRDRQKTKKTEKIAEDVLIESNVNPEVEVSWKDSYWIFEDENLRNFEKKLERRYNISISVEDTSMYDFRYTGKLKDESLDEVLEVLTMTSPLLYSKNGNKVTLYVNKDFQRKLKDSWKTD